MSTSLSPSELILNPDGSIYHLHLRPGQVAKTILTVGDPARVERISRHFDRVDEKVRYREFLTHTGELAGKRLSVISTGIGTDNIDIVINEVDALFNIDFETRQIKEELEVLDFIRVGTSGSLQADIPVDALVCSAFGAELNGLMSFYRYESNAIETLLQQALHIHLDQHWDLGLQPMVCQGDANLLAQIGKGLVQGITMTCEGFYAPQGRILRAPARDNRLLDILAAFESPNVPITNFEMETSSIYGLSNILGHRALSTNVILANRANQTFSKDPKKAVDRLIERVLEKLITNYELRITN